MAKDDRIRLPSGTGGLTTYYDEYHSKLRLKPEVVIALVVLLIIIVILLNIYGGRWLPA